MIAVIHYNRFGTDAIVRRCPRGNDTLRPAVGADGTSRVTAAADRRR